MLNADSVTRRVSATFGAGISFSDIPDTIYSRVSRLFGSKISCGDTTKASAPFHDIGGDRADHGDLPSLTFQEGDCMDHNYSPSLHFQVHNHY